MAKTIVVMYMQQNNANDGYEDGQHLLYTDKGSGKAVVIMDGKKINATWSKTGRTGRTMITDTSGNDIKFTRGKLWFEIIPLDGVLTVQ